MSNKFFQPIAFLLILILCQWSSQIVLSKQIDISTLTDLSARRRYGALLQAYSEMSETYRAKPEILYLVGFALMKIRKPEQAKQYLQAALKRGFSGYPNWISAREMLQKINTIESLKPPFIEEINDENSQTKIRVYGLHTEWINYVVAALPAYLKRAEEVFGTNIPLTSFYLFADREAYDQFFQTMFDGHQPQHFQDGTGDKNIVLFCQIADSGRIETPAGSSRALGNVLHEYSHSLCNTIYGDNYLVDVPQWLDEGIADYVAEPYFAQLYRSYDQRLKEFARDNSPPSYKEMSRELHKDANIRYAIACMMVKELVADKGAGFVSNLLARAIELRNFNKAIIEVAGYRPEVLLQRVIQKYWG